MVTSMDRPMPSLYFRVMSGLMRVRDAVSPRRPVLEEAGLSPGTTVLDYGCGPGSYTLVAAEMVGPSGHVYAADIHPMAIERIERRAAKRGLDNITTILTDRDTGLPDGSVEIALMYDVLHMLSEPRPVLEEVRRVLRPDGFLSISWHDVPKVERLFEPMREGLFELRKRGEHCINYSPVVG